MTLDQHEWNESLEEACRNGECTREECDRLSYHEPAKAA